ncbi:RIP metalloprotease RseP [Bartonella schoenbuchensis]|uniref:Zinc metalloprotease n=2 Tax=Bartonella schoenbuchensis TaxID=165694 RepID=E6YYP4_BARSR|nr:RIP metalloprotease RseP [Bartonella schoenbuchensis]AQX30520.1 site-2 protease, Metallo peptidase, MEROPS family M50B [Bartonella schoenbuchensis R1]CBI82055.1 zinc metalloprotease [Bartonella schoenbuchensis R1]CDP79993.1 membrane-associated zinc metalloprotease [Bartonella schoenbuchensis]
MEFFHHIFSVGDLFLRGLGIVFVIMVIIFVHEMGHYLIGRWCGIRVSVFSLGFGPQIFSYTDKHGTQWRLALILLGGYVKFVGDKDGTSMLSSQSFPQVCGSFASAHAWKRAATVFAGPLFNILFSIVVLTFFFFSYGRVTIEPVVGSLVENAPAIQAGLVLGDRFVEMDGQRVESFEDLITYVTFHSEDPIEFKLERMGQVFKTVITPTITERDDGFGNRIRVGMIGVGAPVDPVNPMRLDQAYKKHIHYNLLEAVREASKRTAFIITQTVFFVNRLMEGQGDRCQLSGPSKTVKIAWQISESGFISLLNFTAFLSIGIGLINLFPIPPLDGGHLLFYVIEAIAGRRVPIKIQEIIFYIGFFVVFMFMIFALFNDYFCWFGY